MKATLTFNEKDIAEAMALFVKTKGFRMVGDISVQHYSGDMREPATTSITVQVEPAQVAP